MLNKKRRGLKTQPSPVIEKIIVNDNTSTDNLLKQLINITEKHNENEEKHYEMLSKSNHEAIKTNRVMLMITICAYLVTIGSFNFVYSDDNEIMRNFSVIFTLVSIIVVLIVFWRLYRREMKKIGR